MGASKKLKIGLLYGGKSAEREVSMHTAEQIKENLDPKKYAVVPIEISASGVWPKQLPLDRLVKLIDVAFIAMHGPYGEDGTMQGFLETLGIPYTFSGVLSSALAMDKFRTAMLAEYEGFATPQALLIRKTIWPSRKNSIFAEIKKFGKKVVIKPNKLGSSVGISLIANDPLLLTKAINGAFKYSDEVLAQEFVDGLEITAAVLGNATPKALPLVEIIPTAATSEFYDYQSKYGEDGSEHVIPARLSKTTSTMVQNIAVTMHEMLGCRGVSRSDFIVTKQNKIYFLEVNTIPGMTKTSLYPQSAAAAKIDFPRLLDTIITLALKK